MIKRSVISALFLCLMMPSYMLRAEEIMRVAPVVVEPLSDVRELNQEMLVQDRLNREEEMVIKGLIEENKKLTDKVQEYQQGSSLGKINQTMVNYRDSIVERDRLRIIENGQKVSPYNELIQLTRDVDAVKGLGQTIAAKKDVMDEKFKLLRDLKEQMLVVNQKLGQPPLHPENDKKVIEQANKINILTQRLTELDMRIANFDKILAEKDRQIEELNKNLAKVQGEKDLLQKELSKNLAKTQGEKGLLQEELSRNLAKVQGQKDLLKSELENKITEIRQQGQELAQRLKSKDGDIQSLSEGLKSKNTTIEDLKQRIQSRDSSIEKLNQGLAVRQIEALNNKLALKNSQTMLEGLKQDQQGMKDELNKRIQGYKDMEKAVGSLKEQLHYMDDRLVHKQQQIESLKAQLDSKEKDYLSLTSHLKGLLRLARQLIHAQGREIALLDEKNSLILFHDAVFEKYAWAFEEHVRAFLEKPSMEMLDFKSRVETLESELSEKEREADILKAELDKRISNEQNQTVLLARIQSLRTEVTLKSDQIERLRIALQSARQAQYQADALRVQLVQLQEKVDLLKKDLENKDVESAQTTQMLALYQQKLELAHTAYNQELQKG
ncbi:MAG: hypothetical protein HQL13_03350, partial [Candidatus Omnitrophica bacterium]|nr:hypothetical protein [Candidatus Omnitrophota bacterium]